MGTKAKAPTNSKTLKSKEGIKSTGRIGTEILNPKKRTTKVKEPLKVEKQEKASSVLPDNADPFAEFESVHTVCKNCKKDITHPAIAIVSYCEKCEEKMKKTSAKRK